MAQHESNSHFVVCYDFGCKSTQDIHFDDRQWHQIDAIFNPPALSPWVEKQQIRRAVALMEEFSGSIVGTHLDLGGNYNGEDIPFQQDCIDESTNTMQYLHALTRRNLLHWHRAAGKQRRIVWLFTHWSALIEELPSGDLYAVDSWYRDNGEAPYVQPLAEWQDKCNLSPTLNP